MLVLTGISTSADNDVIIHGCLNNAGHLRVVSGPSECKRNETPTWWNKPGPQGPQGGPGPQGDVGPPEISGYEIVTTEWTVGFEGYETKEFFCQCPGSKYVLGGGARIWVEPEYIPVVEITGSYPTELGEWCVEVVEFEVDPWEMRGRIILEVTTPFVKLQIKLTFDVDVIRDEVKT